MAVSNFCRGKYLFDTFIQLVTSGAQFYSRTMLQSLEDSIPARSSVAARISAWRVGVLGVHLVKHTGAAYWWKVYCGFAVLPHKCQATLVLACEVGGGQWEVKHYITLHVPARSGNPVWIGWRERLTRDSQCVGGWSFYSGCGALVGIYAVLCL